MDEDGFLERAFIVRLSSVRMAPCVLYICLLAVVVCSGNGLRFLIS